MITSELFEHIPRGRQNAVTRAELAAALGVSDRQLRKCIHQARLEPPVNGCIIISTSAGTGYFLTDDPAEIRAFIGDNAGRAAAIRATIRQARRALRASVGDEPIAPPECRLRAARQARGMTQAALAAALKSACPRLDGVALSKIENGDAVLTPAALAAAAEALGTTPEAIYPNLAAQVRRVLDEV